MKHITCDFDAKALPQTLSVKMSLTLTGGSFKTPTPLPSVTNDTLTAWGTSGTLSRPCAQRYSSPRTGYTENIIRAVAGQRSSPDLCFVTKSINSTTKDIDLIVTQVGCDGTA